MKYFYSHIVFILIASQSSLLFMRISSCSQSSKSTSDQNLSTIYKTAQDILHPSYVVFHRTTTISELHFKINSKELLYSKQAGSEAFMARFTIQYRLISSYESKDMVDSATVTLSDAYSTSAKDIIGKIDFNAAFANSYLLELFLTDLNRNVTSKAFIPVDKRNFSSRQNFIVLSAENKTPIFRDYLRKNEKVLIRYRSDGINAFVRYYNRNFPLPAPPFATSNMAPFDYRADSVFNIRLQDNDTTGFLFKNHGFFHIQTDTSGKDGLTLYKFYDDFPQVKTPQEMLPPLRYITSRQEFDVLSSYKNQKVSLDSFWVYAGGGHDRARELVKKFYNRVLDANNYFSSYLEGWKTDRGLLYIIYGPPSIVYKSSNAENWVYGEENNFNSLTFSFQKVTNPFTGNDYRLDRSPVFKTSWFNYVDMWRQGRVYSEK